MGIAVVTHANIEASSLQGDCIGTLHIQFGKTGFLQLSWEELILPVLEGGGSDLVLQTPLIDG
jgi:hypothetical protein